MKQRDALIAELQDGRQRFLALVAEVRPELHRYCARMTGSIADGEDIVQDTLARAYFALSEMEALPALRPWLFQIAHHRALDFLRRYDQRMVRPLGDTSPAVGDTASDPEDALAQAQAVRAAVSLFVQLPPAQRSCVILKDVLGYALEDIATLLELSVPAVKSALHRGRSRLLELNKLPTQDVAAPRPLSPVVARYATMFNARDWDGVRSMLADDVRLDLALRSQRSGRRDVAVYFTNYARADDWHLVPAWLDDREVIAVFRHPDDARPGYFIELALAGDRIAVIRDFRYVPYVAAEATFHFGQCAEGSAGTDARPA
jgi:RNA polymerase sigma factor (sigma-70 family)